MPAGRPTDYKEAYCEEVVNFMAQGYSLTAFAGEIGVSRQTITNWMDAHPEFLASVKKGKAKCARWWEDFARGAATGELQGKGAATISIFGLKNMAPDDWADKQQVDHRSSDGSMTPQVVQYALPDNGRDKKG